MRTGNAFRSSILFYHIDREYFYSVYKDKNRNRHDQKCIYCFVSFNSGLGGKPPDNDY